MRKRQEVPPSSLTDEQAKNVIRQHFAGYGYSALADRTGYSESTIRSLCQGVNRGHLLMQVEREPKPMMGGK